MRKFVTVAVLIAAPMPAWANGSYGGVSIPYGLDKAVAATPDKIMCVSDDVTGSRLESNRTCHKAVEWVEIRKQAKAMAPFAANQGAQCPDPKNCAR
ncbi:hypothetical protein DMC47_42880 [Nostoc sp. 3335mG]|nr:hypothetical protein DMC47_42880 [Nostoc sp. 3335mG]